MADNESFGFDAEDVDRVLRGAGEQLRGVFGQFGRLIDGSGDRTGWSGLFDDHGRSSRTRPRPETAGEAGDGVWVVYAVAADGAAQVEQVHATEIDALRANQHNTDQRRAVRFLPYGLPVTVLDKQADITD